MYLKDIADFYKKKITFRRITSKHVSGYKIYAQFKDDTYASGIREELVDEFENPGYASPVQKVIQLEYNDDYTWKLPDDIYLDREHGFKIYVDQEQLSTMYFEYNKISKIFTIDKNMFQLKRTSKISLEYYRDLITRTYVFQTDCNIKIQPIFSDTFTYGTHNVII